MKIKALYKIISKSKTKNGYAPTPFKRKGVSSRNERGYAILEFLFYISFFAVLALVVIDSMIVMSKSFKETAIQAEFAQSGNMLERISREIRTAYSIDATSTSTDLKLNTNSGANTKIEFNLLGSNLQLLENEILVGNLNTPNIIITALAFTPITTAKGTAVRISFSVRSANDVLNRTQDFYDTIVLRGSY